MFESLNVFGVSREIWFALIIVWTLPWKAYALWKSAGLRQKWWFIAILVVNTLAILEIVYIFYFSKKATKEGALSPASSDSGSISFDDFQKFDIRVGKIVAAEPIEKSDRLVKLTVDTGGERTIVAGIGVEYSPEELAGKSIAVLTNLEPKKLMGVESQGMILAADVDGKAVLLHPDKFVPAGSKIR